MTRKLDIYKIFAALSFIIGFVTYWSSAAPTTSFWDCGEFIACSYTMGVPHPPGSPLFILLGRFASLLPIASDIGLRVNMLSVLFSAFSLLLTFLTIVRLIKIFTGSVTEKLDDFIIAAGSFIGTMTLGFSYSFWFNSVEAEVYSAATFFTAIAVWLILKWTDYADQPKGDKILLLLAYTFGLATGIHLLNLLALWTIFQIAYFHKFKFTWKGFILQTVLASAAFLIIYPGIIKYIPTGMEKVSVWIPVVVIIAIVLGMSWAHKNRRRIIALSLTSILLIILGYSTYSVIFIRSGLNPSIDENNPDNLPRLVYYLNREQYGDAPLFDRRWNGNPEYTSKWDFFWRYQIHHMYTRYFLWQFVGMDGDYQNAPVDFTKYFALPLLLGLVGMALHFQKDGKRAFSVLSLFFMAGYGIVLYLNQEDPQPRERDYSYVGSFYAYALWIGIGAYYVIWLVKNKLKGTVENRKLGAYAASALLLIAVPGNMLFQNYEMCKRSGEYVAWDYSYNILQTCDKDGIIFTNGDNDTFPLWYLQEVEGVRKDVRIVNLSLLNTGWYIKQLKDQEPKVPISFTDDYIEKYIDAHDWTALQRRYWPPEANRMVAIQTPEGTYEWELPATMNIPIDRNDTGKPNFLRVQDLMILNIISANQGKKPIYFAVTVSNSNMVGLRDYLTMEGLAFKVSPERGKNVDPEKLRRNLFESYSGHFRNLDNPNVHFNDNIQKLLQNYRSAFLQLAYYYYTHKSDGVEIEQGMPLEDQYAKWDSLSSNSKVALTLDWMEKVMPEEIIPLNNDDITVQLGRMYYEVGRPEELRKRLDRVAVSTKDWQKKLSYAMMYQQWLSDTTRAAAIVEQAMKTAPDSTGAKVDIAALLGRLGKTDRAEGILQDILKKNPSFNDRINIANAYYMMNNDNAALQVYQKLYAENKADGQVVGGMLSVYERMGNYAGAVELLDGWLTDHPGDAQAQARKDSYSKLITSK